MCQLFTVVVAIYLMLTWCEVLYVHDELYTYTHNYNSVNLGSVLASPAGTHSFQLSLWKHGIQTLSFSSSSCQLLWVHLSPPFHRQVIET